MLISNLTGFELIKLRSFQLGEESFSNPRMGRLKG